MEGCLCETGHIRPFLFLIFSPLCPLIMLGIVLKMNGHDLFFHLTIFYFYVHVEPLIAIVVGGICDGAWFAGGWSL